MTSSKKKAEPRQLVTVDARKLGQGLKTTFEGVALVFDALGVEAELPGIGEVPVVEPGGMESKNGKDDKRYNGKNAAEKTENDTGTVTDTSVKVPSDEVAKVNTEQLDEDGDEVGQDSADIGEVETLEDTATEAGLKPEKEVTSASTVTQDDVTKVIVQKIKQDRGNNAKIGQILKTYGVSKVGELPASQYEAFLTDLAAL